MNKEVLNKAKALDFKIDYLETLIDLLTQCGQSLHPKEWSLSKGE